MAKEQRKKKNEEKETLRQPAAGHALPQVPPIAMPLIPHFRGAYALIVEHTLKKN